MANLQHLKASRVQILNAFPGNDFGKDGDIACANINGKGAYLCIKNNGRWFVADKLNDINQLDKPKMENLKVDSLAIRNAKLDTSKQTGDLTVDVHGDIALSADGGNITMDDGTNRIFDFDVDGVNLKIVDDANTADYFNIAVEAEGATTISTVDADTAVAHLTLNVDGDIVLNAGAGNIYFKDGLFQAMDFDLVNKRHTYFYDSTDYYRLLVAANGVTTLSTNDNDGTGGHLSLKPNGILKIAADDGGMSLKEIADAGTDTGGFGQIWVHDDAPNVLMFTDDTGIDAHISEKLATWGGGLGRTTAANGKWLGIPTGYQGAYISFGTDVAAPDTSFNPSTTADDLLGVIWQPLHTITIAACRIHYAQGWSVNTRHSVCLMRYDIDADGTLSSGVEVAGVDNDGGSDDYTTLAFTDLTMTSDVAITNAQVLIAMVYCVDAINGAVSAKCTIEYL